jgi:hypothetical protein
MTLKRKCAQRSWGRDDNDVSLAGSVILFFHHFGGAATVPYLPPSAVARHLLRELESALHNQLLPSCWSSDRGQEQEQIQKPVAPFNIEADAQRQGQRLLAQRRHEPDARLSPKGTFYKEAQPPLAPPLQRAAVNPKDFVQPLHSLGL